MGAETASEIHAILDGLTNLQARIEQAGRTPDQFGVEVRCQPDTVARLQVDGTTGSSLQAWHVARAQWKQIGFVAIDRSHQPSQNEPQ